MSQTLGIDNFMPSKYLKHLPRRVVFPIKGSKLAVVGLVDWAMMTLSEDTVVTQVWKASETFTNRVPEEWIKKLPKDITFAVSSKEDHWEVSLFDLDYHTFESKNLTVQRDDNKFWSFIMAGESDHLVPEYDLVFSRAWGYLAPIFRPVKGAKPEKIQGKRLIALEVAGAGGYVGSVTPGVRFFEGRWQILVQKDKNIGPDLQGIETWRAVRFNVQKPDRPEPIQHGVAFALNEVDLMPSLVASGLASEKGRVKNLMNVYTPDFVPQEGHRFVDLDEYMPMADQPGLATLYQWFCWKFTEFLGQIEGLREDPANVQIDPEVSYGTPIRVALIKHPNTWMVVYQTLEKGRFSRSGYPIPAVEGYNFDPSTIPAAPSKIHRLWAVNPNNKRETGSSTADGLHPIEVYEYEHKFDTTDLEKMTLCEFARSGDATTQAALAEWIWYRYGTVFASMNPDSAP